MKLSLQEVAQMVQGRIFPPRAEATVEGISTDSRTLARGELYVPLRGERFDGHDFLAAAVRQGAAACLSEEEIAGFPVPVIRVEDTLKALGDLAAGLRRQFAGPVVAVTGSSGKTTTKDMLGAILAQTGPGLKTAGNFNNLIGVPLTLFRLERRHRWAVLEMGMSARREIARLTEIANPTVGVITNIGPAHLETLQSLEGVARAKGELFAGLGPQATAVVNGDDEKVRRLPVANGVRRLVFGSVPEAAVRAEEVSVQEESVRFRLILPDGPHPVRLAIAGRHNVANALAAATAACALEVAGKDIVRGLESFRPAAGRMQTFRLPGGGLLVEDSYNANPLSVRVALEALEEIAGGGRRVAVLGDMLELGGEAAGFHREVGWLAARHSDFLVVLGEMAEHIAAGAREAGMAVERVRVVDGCRAAIDLLKKASRAGDRVLVKGSRGMKMEQIAEALREGALPLAANNG